MASSGSDEHTNARMQSPDEFPATAWSLVEKAVAGGGGNCALNELAERYWRPIYVYLRRTGRQAPEAEDLTQAFFVHLFEKSLLERTRVREVRFRAFLRSVLEHFLANAARTAMAQKRRMPPRVDLAKAEEWLAAYSNETPETAFDDLWAVELLERTIQRLRAELRAAQREWVADALLARSGFGTAGGERVCDLSRRYGVNENQLSIALHRAPARLKELILGEIRQSVATPEEAEAELQQLLARVGKHTL